MVVENERYWGKTRHLLWMAGKYGLRGSKVSGMGEYDSDSGLGIVYGFEAGPEGEGGPHLQSRQGCDRFHFRAGNFDKMLMPRWAEYRDEEFAGKDAQKIQYDGHFLWSQ
ncbi:MAG: hypothetical protein CL912_07445 [Deltaproteobacteria bacterium]|nr:hypothetical protein [Deltaproteobacteria bacterium]